jgi:hypothetical protein
MNTPLNCLTCGATFHQYNLKQNYCSATCRNKAFYAKRKHLLEPDPKVCSAGSLRVIHRLRDGSEALIRDVDASA